MSRPINTLLEYFICEEYREGGLPKRIAHKFKCGIWTVYRALHRTKLFNAKKRCCGIKNYKR